MGKVALRREGKNGTMPSFAALARARMLQAGRKSRSRSRFLDSRPEEGVSRPSRRDLERDRDLRPALCILLVAMCSHARGCFAAPQVHLYSLLLCRSLPRCAFAHICVLSASLLSCCVAVALLLCLVLVMLAPALCTLSSRLCSTSRSSARRLRCSGSTTTT